MIGKGSNLPDDHHVMRHVPWARLWRDESDQVIGFLPQAFALRPEEVELSVNWVEYFGGDRKSNIRDSVIQFRKIRNVGKKSAFGIGRVEKIKETCNLNGAQVRIVYSPGKNNPAHSCIRRLPRDDLALLEALASDAFNEMVMNVSV